ncbi:MAG TPA: hypothetical protein VMD91_18870 [Candidatus Sulfotelmatobacter sp.]|nr:hypothetical protein [Candidatus Sulfotelmatobacter sp.]
MTAARPLAAALAALALAAGRPVFADPTTPAAPAPATLADTSTTVSAFRPDPVTLQIVQPRPPSSLPALSRMALYVLQGIDAVQSGRALRINGAYERNGMMRPFSHAGTAGMALGFALGDVVRDFALRRSSEKVKLAAEAAQAASNVAGILTTRATLDAASHP